MENISHPTERETGEMGTVPESQVMDAAAILPGTGQTDIWEGAPSEIMNIVDSMEKQYASQKGASEIAAGDNVQHEAVAETPCLGESAGSSQQTLSATSTSVCIKRYVYYILV